MQCKLVAAVGLTGIVGIIALNNLGVKLAPPIIYDKPADSFNVAEIKKVCEIALRSNKQTTSQFEVIQGLVTVDKKGNIEYTGFYKNNTELSSFTGIYHDDDNSCTILTVR